MRTVLSAALISFVLAGCAAAPTTTESSSETSSNADIVMCASDVQTCPDGSTVARDPKNNCVFKTCPTVTKAAPALATKTIPLAELKKFPLDCDVAATSQTTCPAAGDTVVKITTTKGVVWAKLFPQYAPKAVENFVGLAERGYYDGLLFHRVIPDFMIQGGDPSGNGTGGESIWGRDFADEISSNLKHLHGALSMANRGPNTNGSQFFIVQNASGTGFLDGGYTIFGQTFSGLAAVDAIATVPRDAMDKPLADEKMTKVEAFTVAK